MPILRSRRFRLGAAVLAVIAAGIGVRYLPLGLPREVVKYAGSVLWGAMVYGLVAFLRPTTAVGRLASAALALAVLVELFRLIQTPELDAFRLTLAGQLLLGRIFSPWNILAYAVGIGLAAALDTEIRRLAGRRRNSADALATPGGADSGSEPPRAITGSRPAEFS
ncbi:ribosomal maturation YjgA family protein [Methylorubrum aminovorans]